MYHKVFIISDWVQKTAWKSDNILRSYKTLKLKKWPFLGVTKFHSHFVMIWSWDFETLNNIAIQHCNCFVLWNIWTFQNLKLCIDKSSHIFFKADFVKILMCNRVSSFKILRDSSCKLSFPMSNIRQMVWIYLEMMYSYLCERKNLFLSACFISKKYFWKLQVRKVKEFCSVRTPYVIKYSSSIPQNKCHKMLEHVAPKPKKKTM